jgi:hypothetical protein
LCFESAPLNYTARECDKCDIKTVELEKEIVRRDDKYCSFDVQLAIDSNVGGNFSITPLFNDVIVVPSTFVIQPATYRTEEPAGALQIATDSYPSGVYLVVVRSKNGQLNQQKLVIK